MVIEITDFVGSRSYTPYYITSWPHCLVPAHHHHAQTSHANHSYRCQWGAFLQGIEGNARTRDTTTFLLRGFPSCFASKSLFHQMYFYRINHLLISQVEGQTYKIHRYFLTRESQFFNDLFSLPPSGDSASIEGSDSNPITVPGTPVNEIENLLRFFYFGYETCH